MGTQRRTVREVLVEQLVKHGCVGSKEAAEVLILNLLHQEKRLIHQEGLSKLDVSKEPHWLYKDFNVLYRCAKALADACNGRGDARPYPPLRALEAQLERLAPAFTDTEEIRAAMRGE